MDNDKETPEIRREKMRQEELKNPSSSIHGSNLADLFGGLGWRGTGILILLIVVGGIYLLLKFNPPLEIGTIASSEDNKSVVIGIGNNGFREVQILDVSVNNNEKPLETRLQVSNALQGFIITDDYKSEKGKKFGFTDIDEIAIKTGTLPSSNYEELDNGAASKDDEIYGVSVIHNEEINNVHIEYSHFGMTFNDTVYFNNY
ncbi:hypothetical protein JOC75_001916 [Metabacillus crassostreae]|uniref:DUF6366 family protein n=1 Tax=Metabacillus crassostreae TaxID=929098 RepID=UPI003084318C|nr:hypothetical protein [Metabacillus crassostreae]